MLFLQTKRLVSFDDLVKLLPSFVIRIHGAPKCTHRYAL